MSKIRIAPLVRVSTERQEARGSSLSKQKADIESAIKTLDVKLIADPWRFSGQEHSTEGEERLKLDRLLDDAKSGLFDAIMIPDESRWGRDSYKSEEGLKILKDNGIRFFCLTREINLFDETAVYMLRSFVNLNAFVGLQNARKSIETRIKSAREGVPSSGPSPYGRIYDREKGEWHVDPEKQGKMRTAAGMYLNGDTMESASKAVGINANQLRGLLREKCGDTWTQHFDSDKLNVHVKVPTKVPALLDKEMIDKIHDRLKLNIRTRKHEYLLSRYVVCGHCGYALYAETIDRHQYYGHQRTLQTKARECQEKSFKRIRADLLEQRVMADIFQIFGDREKRVEILKAANNGHEENERLRVEIETHKKEIAKNDRMRQNLVDSIAAGIPIEEIKPKMDTLISQRDFLQNEEIPRIEGKIRDTLSREEIERIADAIGNGKKRPTKQDAKDSIEYSYLGSESHLQEMTLKEKRRLLESLFTGKNGNGQRCGIYLFRTDTGWRYELHGSFMPLVKNDIELNKNSNVLT